ncbi:hypothetical protein SpCBS45565_g00597 [Spizellomyces sp. 'palustris']|nr:hypothetical protein SpCBS45565_g00597 [Spizellomyces sp. 'palustris']
MLLSAWNVSSILFTTGALFRSLCSYVSPTRFRKQGRSRGFGFVTFADAKNAEDAVAAMKDQELDGRPIRVDIANERPPRDENRGGGGGYRNRDSGYGGRSFGGDRGDRGFRGSDRGDDRGSRSDRGYDRRDDRDRRDRRDDRDDRNGGGRSRHDKPSDRSAGRRAEY